jgi:hypothetical protein
VSEQNELSKLKASGVKLGEGLYAVGEYRGYTDRVVGDKTYYQAKVLIGDEVKKFDVKAEFLQQVKSLTERTNLIVQYYVFKRENFSNSILTGLAVLG